MRISLDDCQLQYQASVYRSQRTESKLSAEPSSPVSLSYSNSVSTLTWDNGLAVEARECKKASVFALRSPCPPSSGMIGIDSTDMAIESQQNGLDLMQGVFSMLLVYHAL